ncbi:Membrane protein containing DUF1058 [Candidatus Magnetomoraceae bacterium gMMP-15]
MKYLKVNLILILLLLIFVFHAFSSEKNYSLFFKANEAYEQEDYETAILIYQELIQKGLVSGSLFYNLGNCFFRQDKIGWAILYYEKARLLIPGDPDLDFNLRYARDRIEDKPEKESDFEILAWLDNFTKRQIFYFFAIVNFLFWIVLILRKWNRSEWSYYLIVGLSILWLIAGISFGEKWYKDRHDIRGVVVASETIVRAGPDEKDTVLFKLHAGTIVNCEREETGWRLIQFTSEKRGWTPASEIIKIKE